MRIDGMFASHNNIPLNSIVTIVNIATGKEVEVAIAGRIPLSSERIVDLSPAAWQALGLSRGADVLLVFSLITPPPSAAMPPPRPEPEIELSARTAQDDKQRFVVYIRSEADWAVSWEIQISAADTAFLPLVRFPTVMEPAPARDIMIYARDEAYLPVIHIWTEPELAAPWEVMVVDEHDRVQLMVPACADGVAYENLPAFLYEPVVLWELTIPGERDYQRLVFLVRSYLLLASSWEVTIIGQDEVQRLFTPIRSERR